MNTFRATSPEGVAIEYEADSPLPEHAGWQVELVIISEPPVYTPENPEPEPDPVDNIYSQVEWLRRFTASERIAIRQAAAANPLLDDYIKLMDATQEVHTADPDTIAGVNTLESVGLLAEGRAEDILNG